uniref:Uncharacterized protein n=1 Tax=Oryza barthii TaxID=65489 RepID=A0A0D3HX28_9ORYZ
MLKKPNQTEARRREPTSISHHPSNGILPPPAMLSLPCGAGATSALLAGWRSAPAAGEADGGGRSAAACLWPMGHTHRPMRLEIFLL